MLLMPGCPRSCSPVSKPSLSQTFSELHCKFLLTRSYPNTFFISRSISLPPQLYNKTTVYVNLRRTNQRCTAVLKSITILTIFSRQDRASEAPVTEALHYSSCLYSAYIPVRHKLDPCNKPLYFLPWHDRRSWTFQQPVHALQAQWAQSQTVSLHHGFTITTVMSLRFCLPSMHSRQRAGD